MYIFFDILLVNNMKKVYDQCVGHTFIFVDRTILLIFILCVKKRKNILKVFNFSSNLNIHRTIFFP